MEPAAKSKRPRRRRARVAIALVIVAALLGIGGQWIGRGDAAPVSGDGDPENGDVPQTPAEVVATAAKAPIEPVTEPVTAPVPETREPERSPPPPSDPAPEPTAVVSVVESTSSMGPVDDDRFASLISLVHSRAGARHFGQARQVLQQLAELELLPAQRERLAQLGRELDDRCGAASREILALARRGEVLAAHAQASAGLQGEAATFRRELGLQLGAGGLDGDPTAAPGEDRTRWPLPVPLARDRAVRARLPQGEVQGTVVDSRSDRVTLRVEGSRGLTFPTVALVSCEPIDVEGAEAAELGFAALQAGDPLLARLWLACAQGRRPAGGSERTTRLAQLLS